MLFRSWRVHLEGQGPTGLVLTRQNVPVLEATALRAAEGVPRGGYVLVDEPEGRIADVVLIADLPALRSVGYRQMWAHLEGQSTLAEARELSIVATRQLAKRQYTWLRAEPDARWVSPLQPDSSDKLCEFIGEWAMQQGGI